MKKKMIENKAFDVYKDWLKTRNITQLREVKETIKEISKNGMKFTDFLRSMGADGQQIQKYFGESWTQFGENPTKAKREFSKMLHESTVRFIKEESDIKTNAGAEGSVVHSIEMSYTPVTDRSNAMLSNVCATDRDLLIQVRHALTAGNLQIAGELIKAGWGSLSLKDRNDIIEFVNAMDPYNKLSEVPKSRDTLKLKTLEKRSETTKDEFVGRVLRTAKEFLTVE